MEKNKVIALITRKRLLIPVAVILVIVILTVVVYVSLSMRKTTPIIVASIPQNGPDDVIASIAWGPEGNQLAIGTSMGGVSIWNVSDESVMILQEQGNVVYLLAWSPDGNKLASNNGSVVQIWDTNSGRGTTTFQSQSYIDDLVWSSDGSRLVGFSLSLMGDDHLHYWDMVEAESINAFTGGRMVWHPDATHVAILKLDTPIHLQDIVSSESATLPFEVIERPSAAWSPDARQLAVANQYGPAFIWDITTSQYTVELEDSTEEVCALIWSPDGEMVAGTPEDKDSTCVPYVGTIQIWDANTGQKLTTLDGNYPVWSPDSSRIATSKGNELWIWEVNTGRGVLSFEAPADLTLGHPMWSPDSSKLAVDGHTSDSVLTDNLMYAMGFKREQQRVWVWDGVTGQLLWSIKDALLYDNYLWHPHNDWLVVGTDEGLEIWDISP